MAKPAELLGTKSVDFTLLLKGPSYVTFSSESHFFSWEQC